MWFILWWRPSLRVRVRACLERRFGAVVFSNLRLQIEMTNIIASKLQTCLQHQNGIQDRALLGILHVLLAFEPVLKITQVLLGRNSFWSSELSQHGSLSSLFGKPLGRAQPPLSSELSGSSPQPQPSQRSITGPRGTSSPTVYGMRMNERVDPFRVRGHSSSFVLHSTSTTRLHRPQWTPKPIRGAPTTPGSRGSRRSRLAR